MTARETTPSRSGVVGRRAATSGGGDGHRRGRRARCGLRRRGPPHPATGADRRFSHPFDARWFVVAQVVFGVQHLAMLAGVLGLVGLDPPPTRLWRTGLSMAAGGLVLLAGCEVLGLTATRALASSRVAGLVGGGVRAADGPGRRRLRAVRLGRAPPAPARPGPLAAAGVRRVGVRGPGARARGPDVAGRLAIGGWMVLYLLLGVALRRAGDMSAAAGRDRALVAACRLAAAVSGSPCSRCCSSTRSSCAPVGRHLFGPLSDLATVVWDLLLVVVCRSAARARARPAGERPGPVTVGVSVVGAAPARC